MRASQMTQRTLLVLPNLGDRADVVAFQILEVFEREKAAWIRWAAEQKGLMALARPEEGSLVPDTRERLKRLLDLATLDADGLSRSVWLTKWHREEG